MVKNSRIFGGWVRTVDPSTIMPTEKSEQDQQMVKKCGMQEIWIERQKCGRKRCTDNCHIAFERIFQLVIITIFSHAPSYH